MKMCWSRSSKILSWLGILWGLLSLATLLTAFLSNVWLYTKEPIRFPNSEVLTSVTFKIGLWRICPNFKKTNATLYIPSISCTSIKYSSWEDITAKDLNMPTPLEFTPLFLSKMRISTLFGGVSIVLISLATAFALIGLYNSDHKTIIACGLFILGGLTLGGGLLIFASVLSDAYFERPKRPQVIFDTFEKVTSSSLIDYKYGWSFFAAGAAFFMAELAAVLSISAYVRRFPTVEDMVRVMVPGAERRLKEHKGLAGEYLVQRKNTSKYPKQDPTITSAFSSGPGSKFKNESLNSSNFQRDEGVLLLNKPAPDICSSNPAGMTENTMGFSSPSTSSEVLAMPGGVYYTKLETSCILDEIGSGTTDSILSNPPLKNPLAGQTVPIVLMHRSQRNQGAQILLSTPNKNSQKNFKMSALPPFENDKKCVAVPFSSEGLTFDGTEMSGFDQNFYSNQFDMKFRLSENKNFNLGVNNLSSNVGEEIGFFGTFYGEKTFTETSALDRSSDVPGTFSATSSSSGTGSVTTATTESSGSGLTKKKGFAVPEKKKKISFSAGGVFSKVESEEPKKSDNGLFECRCDV